jgi:hypothetical protein
LAKRLDGARDFDAYQGGEDPPKAWVLNDYESVTLNEWPSVSATSALQAAMRTVIRRFVI